MNPNGLAILGAMVVALAAGCGDEEPTESAVEVAAAPTATTEEAPEATGPQAQFTVGGQPFSVASVLLWVEEGGLDPGSKTVLVRLLGSEQECTDPGSASDMEPNLNCGLWNNEGSVSGAADTFFATGEHRLGCRWFGPGETVNNASGTFTIASHTEETVTGTITMSGGGASGSMEVTAKRCPIVE